MIRALIDKLKNNHCLEAEEYSLLLHKIDNENETYLRQLAQESAIEVFGREIKTRGLIEISNICKNNCFYCGIRKGNSNVERYRLSHAEIMECCAIGDSLGFQTFVLQGGEDSMHTKEWIENVVKGIHSYYPQKTITLSLGERPKEDYEAWFNAGARRYLLRHETYDIKHYQQLHPKGMSFDNRIKCLHNLKSIGYETGTGIMVGSPFQTIEHIVKDLTFIESFEPEMIGIGPFLPHKNTPFKDKKCGDLNLTLNLLSILRLMHPKANIPATTSLGTIVSDGREQGILCGANVVMPNLSPQKDRLKYSLYDNKICTNEEAAEGRTLLEERIKKIGYYLS